MKKIESLMKEFFADEKGAETVEWVMIAAVLAGIITVVFWGTLQKGLDTAITKITDQMSNPTGAAG
jgi:Flp pilus assembly pilin Flp